MRFEVTYLDSSGDIHLFGSRKQLNLSFHGKGFIFLNENALILQGNMPKFELWILGYFFQKVLYIPTTRTLPYSTILKYKKPKLWRKKHEITYRLPDGKKCVVRFLLTKSTNKKIFANQLEEYLTVAKSFVVS
ncbi:hypothetical protein [Allocoleopsis franciscana]|uniref:Uncharacterized protein n=1 Tax=Allocoleopsis franciscana PCC 7113 TaxID=1173027 RepID=K9WB36_9CYAN|nr:hypothetical protein [Allocoleopsis franciscana]AFZ16727.1 hypothetical protein Mic7113_0819 [Allocoleopsis franciscana PCC 7113]